MRNKRTSWSETFHILRPVCIFLAAIGVVAVAMAVKGWALASGLLALVMVLIAGLLVLQIHRAVRQMRDRSRVVQDAATEAERHYVQVLRRIIRFVEDRDDFIRGHSERVGRLSEQIARQMGMSDDRCQLMRIAGQLHDIGQIAVPEALLNQSMSWSASEYRIVKKHPAVSHEVLRPLRMLQPILSGIRSHHERMNGTGYPSGIHGDSIPVEARVLAVADSFDAMTHDRPHRRAMTPLTAMGELRRCTPAGYDEDCVAALAEVVHLPQLQAASRVVRSARAAAPAEARPALS